jgi:hypothetical protein
MEFDEGQSHVHLKVWVEKKAYKKEGSRSKLRKSSLRDRASYHHHSQGNCQGD